MLLLYSLERFQYNIADIDECLEESHSCQHTCINTNGSYVCDCNEGFALTSDGRTCRGIIDAGVDNITN